jgi:hypothetical protein
MPRSRSCFRNGPKIHPVAANVDEALVQSGDAATAAPPAPLGCDGMTIRRARQPVKLGRRFPFRRRNQLPFLQLLDLFLFFRDVRQLAAGGDVERDS